MSVVLLGIFSREIVFLCLVGDDGFQSTLNSVASNIIGTGKAPGLEQDVGVIAPLNR